MERLCTQHLYKLLLSFNVHFLAEERGSDPGAYILACSAGIYHE